MTDTTNKEGPKEPNPKKEKSWVAKIREIFNMDRDYYGWTRKRQFWGSGESFMLATMGATIGIHNFTRFPYLCKQYGGVYFFFPYLTCMVFFGFPLLLLELALG